LWKSLEKLYWANPLTHLRAGKAVHVAVRAVNKTRAHAVAMMLATRPALTASGCWLWSGEIAENGYGFIVAKVGLRSQVYAVHRLSFDHFKGHVPHGFVVRHACHVRACWNPAHLTLGTKKENAEDTVRAGHASWQRPSEKIIGHLPPPNTRINELAQAVLDNARQRRALMNEQRGERLRTLGFKGAKLPRGESWRCI